MDYLQDLGSTFTGSINKAMLLVKRQMKDKTALATENSINSIRDKLIKIDGKSMLNNPQGVLDAPQRYSKVKSIIKDDFHVMQVKYNPSSIRFSSQAGSFMQSGPGNAGINQITQITYPSRTTMRVDLIFDDVSILDAFMWDKFQLSFETAVTATSGIVKRAKGESYSVKAQIDGLVALITNVYTRGVVFYWSEMAFAGEVTGVNAVYTMFNPQGHPIRGKVSLAIEQSEDSDVTSGGKYWEEAFDRLFGDYSKDTDVDDSSILDQIGNIINL